MSSSCNVCSLLLSFAEDNIDPACVGGRLLFDSIRASFRDLVSNGRQVIIRVFTVSQPDIASQCCKHSFYIFMYEGLPKITGVLL